MKLAIYIALGVVALAGLLWWMRTQLEYRIGRTHVKVRLFGVPLRRIALAEIVRVSKRDPRGLSENWCSTWKRSHRLITIQRSRGWWRYVCLTPKNRYVFMTDLKNAVRRIDPESSWVREEENEENEEARGPVEQGKA